MSINANELYKNAVCQSLRQALKEFESAVTENTNLHQITLWRRKVEDYVSILEKLDQQESVR